MHWLGSDDPECLRPLGGLSLWEASAEVRFPVFGNLRAATFLDASDVNREIATIVYLNGPATTRDVQARISDPLTVYGIRTMLNRLVRKGVVTRRRSGCHSEIVYLPAIQTEAVRELALKRFIERNFASDVSSALRSTLRLMSLEKARESRH